jgi:ribosomal protein L11 methyltransferase
MKSGALFICSGIMDTKEQAVRDALKKNGFQVLEINRSDEWVSFTARH